MLPGKDGTIPVFAQNFTNGSFDRADAWRGAINGDAIQKTKVALYRSGLSQSLGLVPEQRYRSSIGCRVVAALCLILGDLRAGRLYDFALISGHKTRNYVLDVSTPN